MSPECIEVAISDPAVRVRDSKDTARPHLTFTSASWAAFLGTIASRQLREHPQVLW
ncbi:DUF397 domain-containing protein [Streptomyces poriticola]|uniref:DUF397 domain-containing protein n=1 Tax=Streptomyces poriticola TaxID=3120506 RepID=UPI002FCE5919